MSDTSRIEDAPPPFRSLMPLTRLSAAALDEAFARGRAKDPPRGPTAGICLVAPGTPLSVPLAWFCRLFWRGKIFSASDDTALNRITVFDLAAIPMTTRIDTSSVDGRPCLVIDYAPLGAIGRRIHDEVREIEPGVFLGIMLIAGRPILKFALLGPGRT